MSDYTENPENPESNDEPAQKKKLTDMQLRYAQVAAGIVSAFAMVFSLFLTTFLSNGATDTSGRGLLGYLWVVVFLVITFGRRSIENRYRLRLNLFGLVLLDGIAAGIILYTAFKIFPMDAITLSKTWQLVLIIGSILLLLGLGVLWPYLRYRKRVENGTLPPIRLPEKMEDEKTEESQDDSRPTTRDQKIAEMMRELEERKNEEKK